MGQKKTKKAGDYLIRSDDYGNMTPFCDAHPRGAKPSRLLTSDPVKSESGIFLHLLQSLIWALVNMIAPKWGGLEEYRVC